MWGHDEIEVAEASPELRRIAELVWAIDNSMRSLAQLPTFER
jgi:hypothetical protein